MGIDAFVHVAKIREIEQRRRGRVVDKAPAQEDDLSPVQVDKELSPAGSKAPSPRKKPAKKKVAKGAIISDSVAEEAPTSKLFLQKLETSIN